MTYAEIISFGDNSIYWTGRNNGTIDDSQDTIGNSHGIPHFTGGNAYVDSNDYLTSLEFLQTDTSKSDWHLLSPGDLFIDVDNNQFWDYVVELTSWNTAGADNSSNDMDPIGNVHSIYSINIGIGDSGYILSV